MRRALCTVLTLVCTARLTAADAGKDEFFFHDGDSPIVFIGDSITEQRMYTTLVESFVLSRFPTWKVTFRNLGWSGDVSWMGLRGSQRSKLSPFENGLARDILPLKPKAATIDYGMNDARSAQWTYNLFVEHLGKLTARLQENGARVAVLTPSPEEKYEPDQPGGSAYNVTLKKYADTAQRISEEKHAAFADQLMPFIEVIAAGRKAGVLGATGDPRLIPDAVHPNWAGHLVMAASILRGLHAPALVSRCAIDASARAVSAQENCAIELLPAEGKALSFRRTDAALPWPIPNDAQLALSIPGFDPLGSLDRYELAVSGLTAGRFDIEVDGEVVATATADELRAGVNLARRCGPIAKQCDALLAKIQEKNNVFYQRWRGVQVWEAPLWLKTDVETDRTAELKRLDDQIAALEADIDAQRQPKPHVFTVTPTPPARPLSPTAEAGPQGVTLHWREAEAGPTFVIERSSPDGFHEIGQAPAGSTTFTDPGADAKSTYRIRAVVDAVRSRPSLTAGIWQPHGWLGSYFRNRDLTGEAMQMDQPRIDFDWSADPPAPGFPRENFSVRWCGIVSAPASGTWVITATCDDGVRVTVDGRRIIDQWRDQGPTPCAGTIDLKADEPSEIVVEYYQATGGAVAKLEWKGPGTAQQLIPTACVKPVMWTDGR
jgi:lysophospholipase L1-like esterase